jgi:hypothetical protein
VLAACSGGDNELDVAEVFSIGRGAGLAPSRLGADADCLTGVGGTFVLIVG